MRLRKSDGKPVGTLSRRPKNIIEAECFDFLKQDGWTMVTKRGMPDFFCWDGKKFAFVECKKEGQKLSKPQWMLFKQLTEHGVQCYTYRPQEGLVHF